MKILVVDDAGFIRELLSGILIANGYSVIEARNGVEVIEQYRVFKPDMVIMDLVMPEKNGLQATEEILNEYPGAKIIACSTVDDELMVAKATEIGCVGFLKKPFTKADVLNVLNAFHKKEKDSRHA